MRPWDFKSRQPLLMTTSVTMPATSPVTPHTERASPHRNRFDSRELRQRPRPPSSGAWGATRLGLGRRRSDQEPESTVYDRRRNGIASGRLSSTRASTSGGIHRDVWIEHLAAQTLDPFVDVYVGLRHDQRFHRAGDLRDFDDPTGRLLFGFTVNPIRLTDRRAGGIGNTRLTFGGGFEYEGARRGPNRLPSGFRIVLAGRLDLPRAWKTGK